MVDESAKATRYSGESVSVHSEKDDRKQQKMGLNLREDSLYSVENAGTIIAKRNSVLHFYFV